VVGERGGALDEIDGALAPGPSSTSGVGVGTCMGSVQVVARGSPAWPWKRAQVTEARPLGLVGVTGEKRRGVTPDFVDESKEILYLQIKGVTIFVKPLN
jgi:hypothetical protein